MKFKGFAQLAFALMALLLLFGCGETDLPQQDSDLLQTQLADAQAEIDSLRAQLTESGSAEAELREQAETAEAEAAALQEKIDSFNVLMFYEEPDIRRCYLLADESADFNPPLAVIYALPSLGAGVTTDAAAPGTYGEVLAKISVHPHYGTLPEDAEIWYLVRYYTTSEPPKSTVGWVPADKLTEYTAENMGQLVYPLTVKADTVFYADEACVTVDDDFASPYSSVYSVEYLENGVVRLYDSSYRTAYVHLDDLVYPQPLAQR